MRGKDIALLPPYFTGSIYWKKDFFFLELHTVIAILNETVQRFLANISDNQQPQVLLPYSICFSDCVLTRYVP